MRTLTLQRYKIEVFLGVDDSERRKKQTVFCDIHISFYDELLACKSDDIMDTICYDKLLDIVTNHIGDKKFRLIERLTDFIFNCIKTEISHNHKLSVTVYKPRPKYNLECATFTVTDS